MFSELGTGGEVAALGLTLAVHVMAGFALVYTLVRDSDGSARDWWPGDDDGGTRPDPLGPAPQDGGGGLPLADADPSAVRLREPGTIGDGYPRRPRRPVHAPERDPAPLPQGD